MLLGMQYTIKFQIEQWLFYFLPYLVLGCMLLGENGGVALRPAQVLKKNWHTF